MKLLKKIKAKLIGWKKVDEVEVHPNIIRILNKKIDNEMDWRKKQREKKLKLGRTIRGVKMIGDVPGCIVYVKGKTFLYKAKESTHHWICNHGHGGFMGNNIKIYRKLREDKIIE